MEFKKGKIMKKMSKLKESNELNPFLLEPVVRVLMSLMSLADLKNARLVTSLWDEKAVNQLKNKKCKKEQGWIALGSKLKDFTEEAQHTEIFTKFHIPHYPQYLKTARRFPHLDVLENFRVASLTLSFDYFTENRRLNWTEVYEICCQVSNKLEKLRFEFDCVAPGVRPFYEIPEPSDFGNVQFPLLEKFQFETKLCSSSELMSWMGRPYRSRRVYWQIVLNILQNSPKLQRIRIKEFPKNEEKFAELCSTTGFQQITKFECELIRYFILSDGPEYLKKLHFKEIDIHKFDSSHELVQKDFFRFIESQSSTLVSLSIVFEITKVCKEKCEFPLLQNLKKCSLIFNRTTQRSQGQVDFKSSDEFLVPIDFEEKLPNLVMLEVNNLSKFQNIVKNGSNDLKYLNVFDVYGDDDDTLVRKITKKFPEISLIKFLSSDGVLISKFCMKKIGNFEDLRSIEVSNLKDLETMNLKFYGIEISPDNYPELVITLQSIIKKLKFLKRMSFSFDESKCSESAKHLILKSSFEIWK